MNIIIEMDEKDPAIPFNEYNQFTILINSHPRHFQVRNWERTIGHRDYSWFERPDMYTKFDAEEIPQLTIKTEQEKAAEESVAKAKEALEAAMTTLKNIKESKL